MTTLLPLLGIVLIGGRLSAQFATRLGLPGVFGELALGLALAPILIHWPGTAIAIGSLGNLGVLFLMLLAGLETDLSQLKQIGVPAFIIAMCGALLPFGLGAALATILFGLSMKASLIVGVALSATSVSITAATLRELGRLSSRAGGAILLAAVIDDVIGLALLAVVTDTNTSEGPMLAIGRIAAVCASVVALWFISKPLLRLLETHVEGFLALALGIGFLLAWSAQALGGLAPITGAYIAGLLLARAAPQTPVAHGVETLATGFFATMFFVSIGLGVRLDNLPWVALALFTALAIVTKVVGCGLGAFVSRMPFSDSLAIGIGMIPRGEVALIVASLGFQSHLINAGWFSMLVVLASATTLITPPLLKLAFTASPARLVHAVEAMEMELEQLAQEALD